MAEIATRKAYRVTITNWPGFQMIWPARSAGHARGLAYIDGRDAGYDSLKFTDFRARRAPAFDDLAQEMEGKVPWCIGWKDGSETRGCLSEEAANA